MIMLGLIFKAIIAVLGGLSTASALCWLAWTAFKTIRLPEWGPPTVLLVLLFGGALRTSEFIRMVAVFSAIAVALLWAEGKAWRKRHIRRSP